MTTHNNRRQWRKPRQPRGYIVQYRLSGRTLPPRTQALRLGKLFRHTFFRHLSVSYENAITDPVENLMRRAFFLHEDRDQDGLIEYLLLYFRRPPLLDIEAYTHTFPTADPFKEQGWTLTLEHTGPAKDVRDSLVFRFSEVWNSYTPFFPRNRACGPHDILREIDKECKRSGLPEIAGDDVVRGGIILYDVYERIETNKFYSPFRRRYPHWPYGASIQICFEKGIRGPLLLGYGRHIGAGMFYEGDQLTLGTRWDIESHYGLGLG